MNDGQRLSQYVSHDPSDREMSEQWERIEARVGATRARRSFPAAAIAALAVVALVATAFVLHRHGAPSAWDGAVLDSGQDQVSVALGDGSHIDLMPASTVRVVEGSAHSVRLDLHKGSARFDVAHVADRTFSVKTGNVTVRVVGTRFSVSTTKAPDGRRVTVAVERGVVEVESGPGSEPTRIREGETWSTVESTAAPLPNASAEPGPSPAIEEAPKPAPGLPPPAAAEHAKPPAGPVEPAGKSEVTAAELFESANTARQGGDARGAAAAYEALLRRHPGDARAGLAAFELGRLKMDQLGDTRGAVAALQRAVAGAPGSAFREDALARLVRAYATLGNGEACERTRSAYLETYPNGVHAAAVGRACGASP